jgi:hypothetical protein
VLPATFLSCGVLFLIHVAVHTSSQGTHWHLAMGWLLIAGGALDLMRVRGRQATLIPLAVLPLTGFALTLIAIPVAAAS